MYKPEILYHATVDVFLRHTEMASVILYSLSKQDSL